MPQVVDFHGNHHEITEDMWEDAHLESADREGLTITPITYWEDIRRRFRKNKAAVASLIFIAFLALVAIFGPMFVPYSYSEQNVANKMVPMLLSVRETEDGTQFYLNAMDLYLVEDGGKQVTRVEDQGIDLFTRATSYEYEGKSYYVKYDEASGETQLYDGDTDQIVPVSKKVWNRQNLLGTDPLGRDLLSRMVYGSRISLSVALVSSIITVLIGILYGGISGFYGGNVDVIMMRLLEIVDTIPSMLYIIIFMVYLGSGIQNLMLALVITSWASMARLVRGQILSLKKNDYVLAARAIGVKPVRIVITHLIPNCMGVIIVHATAKIPAAIFTEAFLSFIGLGVAPPMPSWGSLCNDGLSILATYPSQVLIPAAAISLTMFAFNFFGDGLRDAFDPSMRK